MLISIITPCYNAGNFLRESIDSIINQTYTQWELILIDDCSTDDTLQIIQEYALSDKRIVCLSTPENSGVAIARNIGIKNARGSHIAFLDSDDLWDENKLEIQMQFMIATGANFSCTGYRRIDQNKNIIKHQVQVPAKINYQMLLKCNHIGLLTVIYNAHALGKFYFEKLGHEDYAYWLNILKVTPYAHGLNQVLSSYRVHNRSISSNKIKAAGFTWNILRNNQGKGLFSSIYYFTHYAFYAIRKRI